MRFLFFVFFVCFAVQLNGQETNCYCFKNDAMDYTEWLYFIGDSVVVVGQKHKTCEDLKIEPMLNWARSNNNVWFSQESKGIITFTKVLIDPKTHVKYADYFYRCSKVDSGLKVHIDYSAGFTDVMGSPDRFYKEIVID